VAELVQPQSGSAGSISDEKRERLLELVRGRTAARPTDLAEDEVMVWPSLVVVEALSAVVFTFLLLLTSILVNAPLAELANPTLTPNPSKAPWYFLNLQELLLHMHPSLAGVIVPTVALVLIGAIPFIDRSPLGVGVLFTSDKGKKIAIFTSIYTFILLVGLVLFDEFVGVTPLLRGKVPEVVYQQVIPVSVMIGLSLLLGLIVSRRYQPTRRELVIAFFTGFVVSFFVLTIIGTAFRGEGMNLFWPWNVKSAH
jgi:menaquinol-cytochrome c reductase cytochrome b/c subunit